MMKLARIAKRKLARTARRYRDRVARRAQNAAMAASLAKNARSQRRAVAAKAAAGNAGGVISSTVSGAFAAGKALAGSPKRVGRILASGASPTAAGVGWVTTGGAMVGVGAGAFPADLLGPEVAVPDAGLLVGGVAVGAHGAILVGVGHYYDEAVDEYFGKE